MAENSICINKLKRTFFFILILSLVAFAGDNKRFVIGNDLEVEIIKDNVYRVIHSFPFGCNSLLVKVSDDEFILVDTPYTNHAMKELYEWFTMSFEGAKLRVINAHFHGDCLGGNDFCNKNDIPTYGSELTVKLLAERGPEIEKNTLNYYKEMENQKYYNYIKDNVFAPPTNTFKLGECLKWSFDNEEVEIYFPGAAHAPDNVVVYFKNNNVLFGGCMIKSLNNNSKGFVGDSDMDNWASAVQNVIDKYGNSEIIIPGHGSWGDAELLSHTYEIFK